MVPILRLRSAHASRASRLCAVGESLHSRAVRFDLDSPLPRFILLYAAMYAAYGVASPFLPAFVNARGLTPEELGLVLAAGTAIRLVSAPLAGRIADLVGALRTVLAVCAALAGVVTLGYLSAKGFWPFLLLTLLHAGALAPIGMLADALAVRRAF